MAKTMDDKLLEDVLSVYADAESQMMKIMARQAKKGTDEGWAGDTLSSIRAAKAQAQKALSKANKVGKAKMGEGLIDAYVNGVIGPKSSATSSVNTSGITNKKLKSNIQNAFDFVKTLPGGYTDPDTVFSEVKYATGNMAKAMDNKSQGAIVVGDKIFINKKFEGQIDDSFIVHELGHKVTKTGSKTTEAGQKKAAEELAKVLKMDPSDMASYISTYASKSANEMYPEALMTYYDAVKKGKLIGGNKKKVVEAIMDQMYTNDPMKAKKASDYLADLDVPQSLKTAIAATNRLLDTATIQVIRNVDDVFSNIQGKSVMGLLAGVDNRLQSTQKALNEYAAKGITTFKDRSGRNWNIGSYAEMCTRTVSAHAAIQGHMDRQEMLDEDLMKVTTIGTTCPICSQWQGVVLSISGKTQGYHTVEQARAAGLFHPNCKHTLVMHITELDGEGKKEITPVDKNSRSYKRNKLIEKQRANERNIRYWKNRSDLAVTPTEKMLAEGKVKEWQNKNLFHCQKNNLRRAYYREGVRRGNPDGPMGPFVGGTVEDAKQFFKDVIGDDPNAVYNTVKNFYGAKEITQEKWLKAEIESLDEAYADLGKLKQGIKGVTPTTIYKKYIGDLPSKDYADLGGYDDLGVTYGKWLKDQCLDIGTGYKIKPSEVEKFVPIEEGDKKLSATELYKKYNGGKAPTAAYKELGGEEALGMKYGKWVETQKKEMIASGVLTKVPFQNSATVKPAAENNDAVVKPAKDIIKKEPKAKAKTKKEKDPYGLPDINFETYDATSDKVLPLNEQLAKHPFKSAVVKGGGYNEQKMAVSYKTIDLKMALEELEDAKYDNDASEIKKAEAKVEQIKGERDALMIKELIELEKVIAADDMVMEYERDDIVDRMRRRKVDDDMKHHFLKKYQVIESSDFRNNITDYSAQIGKKGMFEVSNAIEEANDPAVYQIHLRDKALKELEILSSTKETEHARSRREVITTLRLHAYAAGEARKQMDTYMPSIEKFMARTRAEIDELDLKTQSGLDKAYYLKLVESNYIKLHMKEREASITRQAEAIAKAQAAEFDKATLKKTFAPKEAIEYSREIAKDHSAATPELKKKHFDRALKNYGEADGEKMKKLIAKAKSYVIGDDVISAERYLQKQIRNSHKDDELKPLFALYDYTAASGVYNRYKWGEKDMYEVTSSLHGKAAFDNETNYSYGKRWSEELDKVFDRVSPVEESFVVKRLCSSAGVAPLIGVDERLSRDDIHAELLKLNDTFGQSVISNPGYTSTATYSNAHWKGEYGIVIKVTPGTKAVYAESISHYQHGAELETILKPDQKMRVVRVITDEDDEAFKEVRDQCKWSGSHGQKAVIVCETVPDDQ